MIDITINGDTAIERCDLLIFYLSIDSFFCLFRCFFVRIEMVAPSRCFTLIESIRSLLYSTFVVDLGKWNRFCDCNNPLNFSFLFLIWVAGDLMILTNILFIPIMLNTIIIIIQINDNAAFSLVIVHSLIECSQWKRNLMNFVCFVCTFHSFSHQHERKQHQKREERWKKIKTRQWNTIYILKKWEWKSGVII